MEDRYIIECTCINKDNDFGMNVGDVFYYNKKAQSYRYLTKKWSKKEWHYDGGTCNLVIDEPGNCNPYSDNYWDYCAPVTPKMNNAKIFKRLGETENTIKHVEKIGDFSCKILVLKTVVEEYKKDKK